jgi:carbonic anhydrase/acetyltransferase-like protein (isoleucine patch superfamily)
MTKAKPKSDKKYELLPKTLTTARDGHSETNGGTTFEFKVYQIKALRDIPEHGIRRGTYGGHVESEKNLSQDGSAWIGKNCVVYGNATVKDNAVLSSKRRDLVRIGGEAEISGNAKIQSGDGYEALSIRGNSKVTDNAEISGIVIMKKRNEGSHGRIEVSGNAKISNATLVEPYSQGHTLTITGNAVINGEAYHTEISGHSTINGNAAISGYIDIHDSEIGDCALVHGGKFCQVKVTENARLYMIHGGGSFEFMNSKFSGCVNIEGVGVYVKDSSIEGNARIESSVSITNSKIYGHANLSGVQFNWLHVENSKIGGHNRIDRGNFRLNGADLKTDFHTDPRDKAMFYLSLFGVIPSGENAFTFYLPVRKLDDGSFITVDPYGCTHGHIHLTSNYVFRESEETAVYETVNQQSISDKIRVTNPLPALNDSKFKEIGLTVIEVSVNIDDIYKVVGRDAYVNRVRTIREIKL